MNLKNKSHGSFPKGPLNCLLEPWSSCSFWGYTQKSSPLCWQLNTGLFSAGQLLYHWPPPPSSAHRICRGITTVVDRITFHPTHDFTCQLLEPRICYLTWQRGDLVSYQEMRQNPRLAMGSKFYKSLCIWCKRIRVRLEVLFYCLWKWKGIQEPRNSVLRQCGRQERRFSPGASIWT